MSLIPPPTDLLPATGTLIGAERSTTTGGELRPHVYPATGAVVAEVALAGPADVDRAVEAATRALPGWRAVPADARRDLLLRVADLIVAEAGSLGPLQTLEIGLPVQFTRAMPAVAADQLRYYAGWLDKVGGEVVTTWPARALDYTLDEPYGVVGLIIPWNGPLVSMAQMLGPALAAGNTVVVKPSELTPFVPLRIGELFRQAGFPPGVVNVVPGGAEAGAALVGHPGVDKLHFTGSDATGRAVLAGAAANLTPVALELGGKSAHLVFADAEPRLAARLAMTGALVLSGQGCANGTRVLVESSRHDEVLDILVKRLAKAPIGDPFDPRTVMGPLISAAACDRVLQLVTDAVEKGSGTLVTGGRRVGGELAAGFYLEPTVFTGADPAGALVQDEIFGPVLTVDRFDREDEAVALADGTRYGLGAYLHTRDLRRAHRVAAALRAGSVWVNGTPGALTSAPFGGVKHSGSGRIGGRHGLQEFVRPKNVWIAL